jgi:signal transduction histidine kinase/CheY-like chemotaxis protein
VVTLPIPPADVKLVVERLEAAAGHRLRLAVPLIGGWAAIVLAIQLVMSPAVAAILWPVHVLLILACLVTHVAHRRGLIKPTLYTPVGAALTCLQLGIFGAAYFLGGKPVYLVATVIEIVAAGVLHVRTRGAIATGLVAVVGWLAGTLVVGLDARTGLDLLAVVAAASAALVAHRSIVHAMHKAEWLRLVDERRRDELAVALEAARHELEERKRAEAEREALREQFTQAQKLEAVGTLAGGVAHDMNNVLAAVIGLTELVRDEVDGPARADLDQILATAQRGADLTRNLLGFSRRGKYRLERVALESVVEQTTRLLCRTLPKRVALETSFAHGMLDVRGDGSQLGHVLVNLCLNAADAIAASGTIRITTAAVELAGERAETLGVADGRYVALTFSDDGSGMDEATRRRVFEPFFTTKAVGKGTGLGLAMVYGTVAHHKGAIEVDSAPGRGTTFTIYLRASARRSHSCSSTPRVKSGNGLVLLVDDEPAVRLVGRRLLERFGYQVAEAVDGKDALAVFALRRDEVRLAVLDMSMPVMGGAECFYALRAQAPWLPVLMCSGYAVEAEARGCLAAGAAGFLEKPFSAAQLAAAVARALGGDAAVEPVESTVDESGAIEDTGPVVTEPGEAIALAVARRRAADAGDR